MENLKAQDNVQVFNNEGIQLPVRENNGEVEFDAEASAIGLGISEVAKSGHTVVKWVRVNKYLGIDTSVDDKKIKRGDWISEPDFYTLAIKANNETAKKFQYWVTHEVLPSIRKHGAYMTSEKIEEALLNPDTIINLATQLKSERQARIEAESQLGRTLIERDKLQDRVEREADDVTFAKAITYSNHSIKVRELAAILTQNGFDIGQNQLYNLLRLEGYIGKHDTLPKRDKMKAGYFRVIHGISKSGKAYTTTLVTPNGQKHIINQALKGKFDDAYDKVMTNTFKL